MQGILLAFLVLVLLLLSALDSGVHSITEVVGHSLFERMRSVSSRRSTFSDERSKGVSLIKGYLGKGEVANSPGVTDSGKWPKTVCTVQNKVIGVWTRK